MELLLIALQVTVTTTTYVFNKLPAVSIVRKIKQNEEDV